MKNFILRAKARFVAHKFMSAIVIFIALYGGYYAYGKFTSTADETRYIVANVEKGTLISSVTGSGQVSASNQVELKPKVSGAITGIYVTNRQTVKTGALLVQIDPTTAQKAVRDAETNLETARLSYQQLVEPADALALAQSQNSLSRAEVSAQNAQEDLITSKENGFNSLSNTFIDLPNIMTSLDSILYDINRATGSNQENIDFYANSIVTLNPSVTQFRDDANNKYLVARAAYDKNFQDYKNISRSSNQATIEAMLAETSETTRLIADAIKSANNLIQFYEDQLTVHSLTPIAQANTALATLNTSTQTINSLLTNLLGIQSTIQGAKNTITSSGQTINEATLSLAKLKAGPNALDLRASQISISQKQNALIDAEQTLADYSIRAPFDGTVAKVNVKKMDQASSGTSVVTFVTPQQMATISLNEIDAAKVKVGQKATMTFDAIEELTITGKVSDVDTVGTVSQGVVTYSVQIAFDTQDVRVKPGMTVNTSIITDVQTDTLMVSNSSIKSSTNGNSYVEIFTPTLAVSSANSQTGIPSKFSPVQKTVTVGISNDTNTQILSGLSEGDQVVVRTITAASTAAASAASTRSIFGGGRPGG